MSGALSASEIDEALAFCGSHNRLPEMLRRLHRADPTTFCAVFNEWWPDCDNTWHDRASLLRRLRRLHPLGRCNLDEDAKAFLAGLPLRSVRIYRGGSRQRVRGLSWTTDIKIARGFAHGHRGIRVPDPVVATARIPNEAIFTVFVDRNESEVLVDPGRLTVEALEPYSETSR